jgi:hypothetical protein
MAAVATPVLSPAAGRASVLIPIGVQDARQAAQLAARWVSQEDAQWIAFDPETGRATVIAPDTGSLANAIAHGFLPIASDIPTCTVTPDDRQTESFIP